MHTTFLSLVCQPQLHCRAGQLSPGRFSAEGAALWGPIVEVILGATFCIFSLFSAFSTHNSWRAPRKCTLKEGSQLSGWQRRTGEKKKMRFFFQEVWHRYCYWHGFWLGFILASQGNPADPKVRSPVTVGSLHNRWKEIDASQDGLTHAGTGKLLCLSSDGVKRLK